MMHPRPRPEVQDVHQRRSRRVLEHPPVPQRRGDARRRGEPAVPLGQRHLLGHSACGPAAMADRTGSCSEAVPTARDNSYAVNREKDHGPFPERGPDEGLLMGARNVEPVNGGGDWIITRPEHWIFEGTGVKAGDRIPGLIGWEYHGDPADIPGLEVVAEGTAWQGGVNPQHWTAIVYPGPKGNFVFNAATIFWAQGLSSPPGHVLPWTHWSRPHGPDPRVQRITRNLLQASHRGDRANPRGSPGAPPRVAVRRSPGPVPVVPPASRRVRGWPVSFPAQRRNVLGTQGQAPHLHLAEPYPHFKGMAAQVSCDRQEGRRPPRNGARNGRCDQGHRGQVIDARGDSFESVRRAKSPMSPERVRAGSGS